jgi:hypothetical protein
MSGFASGMLTKADVRRPFELMASRPGRSIRLTTDLERSRWSGALSIIPGRGDLPPGQRPSPVRMPLRHAAKPAQNIVRCRPNGRVGTIGPTRETTRAWRAWSACVEGCHAWVLHGNPPNPALPGRANHAREWSTPRHKNILLLFSRKSVHHSGPSHPARGADRDRHERAVGCGGREGCD